MNYILKILIALSVSTIVLKACCSTCCSECLYESNCEREISIGKQGGFGDLTSDQVIDIREWLDEHIKEIQS